MISSGITYDKWCEWHLVQPEQYSLEQLTAYCFVVDAMNFCFWPENYSGVFEYENMTRNLEKILKTSPDFFTCDELAKVTSTFLKEHVFTTEKEFCLLESRARIVNEVGIQIKQHFKGSFMEFVERTNYDAPTFVSQIA